MDTIPKIEFLKKNNSEIEFEIMTLNDLYKKQSQLNHPVEKPHRVEFYHIMYCTKGSGVHFIDFKPCTFNEESLLFISKGQVHAFRFSPDIRGILIVFTEAFLSKNQIHSDILSLHRLYNYHLHSPVIASQESADEHFSTVIRELSDEYANPDTFAKEEMLRLLLKQLLLKAERVKRTLLQQEKFSNRITAFTRFQQHVEKHCSKTRNARDYADMLGVSYKTLNEICKEVTGSTAKAFIDSVATLEIKRHLATSDVSSKELTYLMGFDEPTNFVKYFKKHTGLSPFQFQRLLTSQNL